MPFIDHLVGIARTHYPTATVTPTDQMSVVVQLADGTVNHINGEAVEYATRGASDQAVRAAIERLFRAAAPPVLESVPWTSLVSIVRAAVMVTVENPHAVWRPLAESIVELLGIDTPDSIIIVNREHLVRWGVTDPAPLFGQGRANVLAQYAADTFVMQDVDGLRLLRADAPEGAETSWTLLPDVVRALTAPAEPIVFVPTRNHMFVVPETHAAHLAAAFQSTHELWSEHPRPVSQAAYRVGPDGPVLWQPPMTHPTFLAQSKAVASQTSSDYGELRSWLQGTASKDFIPTAPAFENNGRFVVPVAFSPDMIEEGGDYLLPAAATMVGIVPEDQHVTFVGMRPFLDTIGAASFAEGIWPPCYRIDRFPDPPTLARLRAVGSDRP